MNDDAARSLLIVDDDATFCATLARSMERIGYDVEFATSGEEALTIATDNHFDCAVVDLRIGAESGLSQIRALLATNAAMRIVVLTGFANIATAVEAIKLGAIHYLSKPATAAEIAAAFDRDAGDEAVPASEDPMTVKRLEWEHLQKVLADHDGNISAAARALKMHRRSLQRKLQKRPAKS
jgi:two-component system response regulator RegA